MAVLARTTLERVTVVVPSGSSESEPLQTHGRKVVGFRTPAALTGTTFTFSSGDDVQGTYLSQCDVDGTPISMSVAVSRSYPLNVNDFVNVNFLKIDTGSNEAADRSIVVEMEGLQ